MAGRELFVGVDGGSSKSLGVVIDRSGEPIARAVGGPANYHTTGLDAVEKNLAELLDRLAGEVGTRLDEMTRFCFALSGLWREADRDTIRGLLARHGIADRAVLVSDVEALLATAEGSEPTMAVVAGTGSVVVARDEAGRLHKVGGNGHLLDDAGSAYDLGISGLRAVIGASDGRGPRTALTRILLEAAGLADVSGIVPWLYGLPDEKRDVARLARHVVDAADKGDSVAVQIAERAAGELAGWCTVAAEGASVTDSPVKVLIAGGLVEQNAFYRRILSERIAAELPHAEVGGPTREPAHAAALIALRDWERESR